MTSLPRAGKETLPFWHGRCLPVLDATGKARQNVTHDPVSKSQAGAGAWLCRNRCMVMKVFISHSTTDYAFVENLTTELTRQGIESWCCEVDVLPGDDFVAEIEKGLQEADLTLLIWSPEATRSAWTGLEWRAVLAREVEEAHTRPSSRSSRETVSAST